MPSTYARANRLAREFADNPTTRTESLFLETTESALHHTATSLLRGQKPDADQMQDVRLAALAALRSYNPRRGQFLTVLPYHMRKALYRESKPLVHIPEHIKVFASKLNKFEAAVLYKYDRLPNDEEICKHLDMSETTLADVRAAQNLAFENEEAAALVSDEADNAYGQADRRIDVQNALQALRDTDAQAAECALLRYGKEMSIQNIAATLRIRYHTAQCALDRANTFLRDHLADYA